MKICLHTYYEIGNPYIGGTQTLLIKLAKELKILGHDAFIVCSSLTSHYEIEGVDVFGVIPKQYISLLREKYNGIPSSKFLKAAIAEGHSFESALSRLAEYSQNQYCRFSADIYHLNSYVAAFPNNNSIPVVAYHHENEDEFDGFWGKGTFKQLVSWIKMQEKRMQQKPLLFTASHYYANRFSTIFNIPIRPVRLGVLLNDIIYSKEVNFNEETTFGRTIYSVVILIPSRFNVNQKGQDLAIKACEILLHKGYDVEVVFSGIKNSLYDELLKFRSEYNSLRIANHIHFVSANDMFTLYESVHIVLSPERYCSYGLSISESLAAGIPTVLSDIPTYLEIAKGYKHAFFFRKDDIEDIVTKLENVISLAKDNGYRYNESAIDFRINNDIRRTAIDFSRLYKSLVQK